MKINEAGLSLIKSFESCRLKAYQDVKGVWTIGWGRTGEVEPGMTCTQDEADEWLEEDLEEAEEGVEELLEVDVSDNQFSALVSFAYNCGLGNLGSSTLLKLVNQEKFAEAAEQFKRWNRSGGKPYAGLSRRRDAERALFVL